MAGLICLTQWDQPFSPLQSVIARRTVKISKDGSPYYIGIGMVPSIIGVWGYDREFCSSSSPPSSPPSSRITQKPNNIK